MVAAALRITRADQLIEHHEQKVGVLTEQFCLITLHSGNLFLPSQFPLLCFTRFHYFNGIQYLASFLGRCAGSILIAGKMEATPVCGDLNNGTYSAGTVWLVLYSFDNQWGNLSLGEYPTSAWIATVKERTIDFGRNTCRFQNEVSHHMLDVHKSCNYFNSNPALFNTDIHNLPPQYHNTNMISLQRAVLT